MRKRRRSRTRTTYNADKDQTMKEVGSWVISILIVMILAYSIVTFGGQTVTVVGQSMIPTMNHGDQVIVNKLAYKFQSIKRYDLIAYKLRDGEDSYYSVKRVIGLPGEKVTIKAGDIYINDELLKDLPHDEYIITEGLCLEGVELQNGEYFVLGDNVNNSEDSRFGNVGNIIDAEILGKVTYCLFPKERRGNLY